MGMIDFLICLSRTRPDVHPGEDRPEAVTCLTLPVDFRPALGETAGCVYLTAAQAEALAGFYETRQHGTVPCEAGTLHVRYDEPRRVLLDRWTNLPAEMTVALEVTRDGPFGPAGTTLNFPSVDDLGVNLDVVAHALRSTDTTSFRALWLDTNGDAIVLRLGVIHLHLHVPAFHPREDRLAWLAETLLELLEHPDVPAAALRDGCEIILLPEDPGLAFTNVTVNGTSPLPGPVVLRARDLDALFMTQVQEDALRAFLHARLTDRPLLWSAADRPDLHPTPGKSRVPALQANGADLPPTADRPRVPAARTNDLPGGALPVMRRRAYGETDWDGRQVQDSPLGHATPAADGRSYEVTLDHMPVLTAGAHLVLLAGLPGSLAKFSADAPATLHATAPGPEGPMDVGAAFLQDDRRGYDLNFSALPYSGTVTLTIPGPDDALPERRLHQSRAPLDDHDASF